MIPNLDRAAQSAIETVEKYKTNNPMTVLKQQKNVFLIAHNVPGNGDNQDAFSLVDKKNGLRFVVLYNAKAEPYKLRFALARELAHVILGHDGNSPESIWSAESDCFAYHFLCANPGNAVNYRPVRICLSWEIKDMMVFNNMDEMRSHIVEERNRFNRYMGKKADYQPKDILLISQNDYDNRTGWKNCYNVVLDGNVIGYCGE